MRRWLRRVGAHASGGFQEALAQGRWFWMRMATGLVSLTVAWSFWSAVYAGAPEVAGVPRALALRYALVAQVLTGAGTTWVLLSTARALREGLIAHQLLWPLDRQLAHYAQSVGRWATELLWRLPLWAVVALLGVGLPTAPLTWLWGAASFVLGASAMFCFEWLLASAAFYTTEVWGLGVAAEAVALFFGGTLLPLDFMPPWLQAVARALPFQQVVYLPASILCGLTPPERVPGVLLTQLGWVLGLAVLSRLAQARAVRVVTVQGG